MLRSGCGFLMAHKEAFVRIHSGPAEEETKDGIVIDLDEEDDPWLMKEFDALDNPRALLGNSFRAEPVVTKFELLMRVADL